MRIDPRLSVLALALLAAGCGKKDAATTAPARQPMASVVPASGVPAPAGAPAGGWAARVVATPDGGFLMGNPDAPVKLLEYGSLTCPHCAEFSAEASPELKGKMVASGKLSYEFRNFIRDGFDLTVALLARCGGAEPFFPLTEQLYATQKDWFGKVVALPADQQKALQALPADQQGPAIARAAGLDVFMKQRGIGWDKATACIADQAAQNRLLDVRQKAIATYNLEGTPTFVVNGKTVGSATWDTLKAQLAAAGA